MSLSSGLLLLLLVTLIWCCCCFSGSTWVAAAFAFGVHPSAPPSAARKSSRTLLLPDKNGSRSARRRANVGRLWQSSPEEEDASSGGQSPPSSSDNLEGETLLSVNLVPQIGVSANEALEFVRTYSQSFPFCAVLPVQPLTYKTTPGGNVQVKFLRKKTDLKPGIDGGINFYIQLVEAPAEEGEDEEDDISQDEQEDGDAGDVQENASLMSTVLVGDATEDGHRTLVQVTAKRNMFGQSITKMMAEKLIVMRFVAGLKGEGETLGLLQPDIRERLLETVQVSSLYHKWMDIEFDNK